MLAAVLYHSAISLPSTPTPKIEKIDNCEDEPRSKNHCQSMMFPSPLNSRFSFVWLGGCTERLLYYVEAWRDIGVYDTMMIRFLAIECRFCWMVGHYLFAFSPISASRRMAAEPFASGCDPGRSRSATSRYGCERRIYFGLFAPRSRPSLLQTVSVCRSSSAGNHGMKVISSP
jgi:hypothetical protein